MKLERLKKGVYQKQEHKKIILVWLPWGLSDKESACHCRDWGISPWIRKIPWRKKWQPTLGFLPGESHGQRSLAGYSPWGCKESGKTGQLKNSSNNPTFGKFKLGVTWLDPDAVCVLSRERKCQEHGTSVGKALDVSFLHWSTHDGGQPESESQIPGPGREANQPTVGHVRPGHTAAGECVCVCVCVCVWCQINPACFYPNWLLCLLSITDCLLGNNF